MCITYLSSNVQYTVIWDIIMIILSMVLMIPQAMLQWTTLPQLLAYRHTPLMNGYHSRWPTHSLRSTSLRDITYLLLTSLLPIRLVEALQDAAGISRPLSVALLLWLLTNAAFELRQDFKYALCQKYFLWVCFIYWCLDYFLLPSSMYRLCLRLQTPESCIIPPDNALSVRPHQSTTTAPRHTTPYV